MCCRKFVNPAFVAEDTSGRPVGPAVADSTLVNRVCVEQLHNYSRMQGKAIHLGIIPAIALAIAYGLSRQRDPGIFDMPELVAHNASLRTFEIGASDRFGSWDMRYRTNLPLNLNVPHNGTGSVDHLALDPSKPVLLMLHGFPTSSWDWHIILPRLERLFYVVAPDLLGLGLSTKPRLPAYRLTEQTDIVEALLDHLGITGHARELNANELPASGPGLGQVATAPHLGPVPGWGWERPPMPIHILAHDYGDSIAQEMLARSIQKRALEAEESAHSGAARHSVGIPDVPPGAAAGASDTMAQDSFDPVRFFNLDQVGFEAHDARVHGVRWRDLRERQLVIKSVTLLNGGIIPGDSKPPAIIGLMANSYLGPILKHFSNEWLFGHSLTRVFGPNTQPSRQELRAHWALFAYNKQWAAMDGLSKYPEERLRNKQRWVHALFDSTTPVQLIFGPADPVSGSFVVTSYKNHSQTRRKDREVALADPRKVASVEGWGRLGVGYDGKYSPLLDPDVGAARGLDSVTELDPGIGHYPQLEAPDQVLDAFLPFISRVNGEPASVHMVA